MSSGPRSDLDYLGHYKKALIDMLGEVRYDTIRDRAYSKEFFGVHNFKSSCMM